MKQSRRQFLDKGIKTGIAIPLLGTSLFSCNAPASEQANSTQTNKKLKILILGGTSFLGPHQIAYAMSRGHSITTFTRGKTKPSIHQDLFKDVEQLVGDREDNLTALEKGNWDAVIDNSGRNAEWTKSSANLLKDRSELYLYTSSTGVYYPYHGTDIKEDTTVLLEEPKDVEEDTKMIYQYGIMKANSEIEARKAYGEDRTIVIRPTYMIGPADKTDRFIHWPVRLARGGEVMIPGKENDRVQYIDVRDVAEWMVRLIEQKAAGTYNAVGPKTSQNMYSFVEEASKAFDTENTFVKIDDYEFLKQNEVYYLVPWIMPEGNNKGSALINNDKAKNTGLTFRELKTTVKDIHDWWYSEALTEERRNEYEQNPNSILAREKTIIQNWKNQ